MQNGLGGEQEDAALLLAIKDAETNTLRQQMAQLSEDLRRNLAVLSTKDEEASKLRGTVDALRSLLAEKDDIFSQFQAQVQELELLRVKETEQRLVLEQLLTTKEAEWQQHQEAAQQGRQAELEALQQQSKEAGDRWAAQLLLARQTALDDSFHRSTQQQAAMERSAEHAERLQQQVESLTCALGVKDSELQAAHKQLGAAMDTVQQLEATHSKAMEAKDKLIDQLKQQLEQQASSISSTSAEHDANMSKLIRSVNQMQESCQTQAQEVQEYSAAQKRLQEERQVLKEQLRQQETLLTKLQTEKGVVESALQHEVTAQASAQAQLNIFQAKLQEAVVELEARCSAAESRASQLMAQLVQERGRLVDAVIEQANSSTPHLAAELAKSLEADRLCTQAELQMAQERSRSLSEDLALIRSTLVPLLTSSAMAAAGAARAGQPPNGAMAALAQLIAHKNQQQPAYATLSAYASPAAAAASPAAAECWPGACNPAAQSLYHSPSKSVRPSSTLGLQLGVSFASPVSSPAAAAGRCSAEEGFRHSSPSVVTAAACAAPGSCRGGTLAGLVTELQADIDQLQQQLCKSRRQLKWDSSLASRSPNASERSRPCSVGHLAQNNIKNSDGKQRQQPPQDIAIEMSPQSRVANVPPTKQLHDALRYLLDKTEQLTAENGALRSQVIQDGSPAPHAARFHSTDHGVMHHHHQQQPLHVSLGSPNHSSPLEQRELSWLQPSNSPSTILSGSCGQHEHDAAGKVPACAGFADHGDTSSMCSGSMHDSDILILAADEQLAAAEAVAAVECARRRRQARAAAAAQHCRSPGKAAMISAEKASNHVLRQQHVCLERAGSAESTATGDSSETTDTLGSLIRSAEENCATSEACSKPSINSRLLLETILANASTHSRPGKLLKELLSAAACNQGGNSSSMAAAHRPVRSNYHTNNAQSSQSGRVGGAASAGSPKTAGRLELVHKQLRQLSQLSPGRQRLLRALAAAAAK